jgi:type II secretory pathway pseudopilin PulG
MVLPMRHGKSQRKPKLIRANGFILIGLLLLIMISGIALAQAGVRWRDASQREREQELIKVGEAYRLAIGRYYNETPGLVKEYPPSLEALLSDSRFPNPRKHLRKLYMDPITQREGWGIVGAPSGGVMGIYSLSDKPPFKKNGFRPHLSHLTNKKYYGEWFFIYIPVTANAI